MAHELVSPCQRTGRMGCAKVARKIWRPWLDANSALHLGAGNRPGPDALGPTFGLSMLAPVLMNYGSEEQQQRFLPDIRDRKVNWCQGYSEPNAGSDLANLKTKAELSTDGSHYVVNGTKIWTTLAHIADWIFCLTPHRRQRQKTRGCDVLAHPYETRGHRS